MEQKETVKFVSVTVSTAKNISRALQGMGQNYVNAELTLHSNQKYTDDSRFSILFYFIDNLLFMFPCFVLVLLLVCF